MSAEIDWILACLTNTSGAFFCIFPWYLYFNRREISIISTLLLLPPWEWWIHICQFIYSTHLFPTCFPGAQAQQFGRGAKNITFTELLIMIMDPKPVIENRFLPHWFYEDFVIKIFSFEPHYVRKQQFHGNWWMLAISGVLLRIRLVLLGRWWIFAP